MPSHHSTKSASHHQAKHTGGSADNNPDRIEWSRSTILGFIEDYRQKRVLWDPNTKGYHIKQIKYEALKQLGHKYGTEIRSIRSKIKSLRSSFHREHGKVINGKRRGIHYQPMWFAYEAIRFILEAEQHRPNSSVDDTAERSSEDKRETSSLVALAAARRDGVEEEVGIKVDVTAGGAAAAAVGGVVDGERRRIYVGSVAAVAAELEDLSYKREVRQLTAELVEELQNAGSDCSSSSSTDGGNNVVVDQAAVKCAEIDGEMNHYCKISAEDVKTELIESESSDTPQTLADKTTQHQHQSPLAYLSLTAVHHRTDVPSPKKRKRTPQPEIAMPSKQYNGELGPPQGKTMNTNNNSKCRSTEECSSRTAAPTKSSGNALQTDEYGVFGEYVAITIRKLKTSKSKIVVKHLINNLLYEAELGKYDYGIPASKEPPQLYKTS